MPAAELPSPARAVRLAKALLAWGRVAGRKGLPWQVGDPYARMVSEVMLQQTRVDSVRPAYARFMERFPTFERLASASEEDVLAVWSGLGYYARARNLRRAAARIISEGVPSTVAGWMSLPGIGRSTAGALVAFCSNRKGVILDGNVRRVLVRWSGADRLPWESPSAQERWLWLLAERLTPKGASGDYAQAIMDLGATVCRPAGEPDCSVCPWKRACSHRLASAAGTEAPSVRRVSERRERRFETIRWEIVHDGSRVLLCKNRSPAGVWRDLWLPAAPPAGDAIVSSMADLRHSFSHFDALIVRSEFLVTAARLDELVRSGLGEAMPFSESSSKGLPSPLTATLREISRIDQ